jgi:fluoride exporter
VCPDEPRSRNPGHPVAFTGVKPLLAISLGGVLGSLARFAIAVAIGPWDEGRLPWATLTVNLVGCVVIGVVAASAAVAAGPPWLRPFLITGVLGGFTTFSALALETGVLMDTGRVATALGYIAVTMVFGLLAVRLGALLVRRPA